jgi:hypothetical protein
VPYCSRAINVHCKLLEVSGWLYVGGGAELKSCWAISHLGLAGFDCQLGKCSEATTFRLTLAALKT